MRSKYLSIIFFYQYLYEIWSVWLISHHSIFITDFFWESGIFYESCKRRSDKTRSLVKWYVTDVLKISWKKLDDMKFQSSRVLTYFDFEIGISVRLLFDRIDRWERNQVMKCLRSQEIRMRNCINWVNDSWLSWMRLDIFVIVRKMVKNKKIAVYITDVLSSARITTRWK